MRAADNERELIDLREVVVEHRAQIYRFARSLCRSAADAEDLAQTALVRALQQGGAAVWVTVTRPEEAVEAASAGARAPVVHGAEAGGHRVAFLDEYGPVSGESLLRARVLALFLNAILAQYGHAEGMRPVATEALGALARTVEDLA